MRVNDMNVESFVSLWFKSDLYKDLYHNIPFPMVGRDDWPQSMEVTLPPARLKSGRPQQKRYPEQGENGNGSNATHEMLKSARMSWTKEKSEPRMLRLTRLTLPPG
ncbi:hypothetical protein ACFE04_026271 [Oxalis oulophora]